jgi:Glyoxalase-like domain
MDMAAKSARIAAARRPRTERAPREWLPRLDARSTGSVGAVEERTGVRLRQAVILAAELAPVADRLQAELGLGEPFADPGVGAFGLHNAVFALGDAFIEVIAPKEEGTAAGRWLERHGGDGGYMVIFQVDDIAAARERAERDGVRSVWSIDLDDISATHLHPSDMRGAIVSIDQPLPPESWRWGGPGWIGQAGTGAPGALEGITVAVRDPEAAAERWASVLGAPKADGELRVDGGRVEFEQSGGHEAIVEFAVSVPPEVRRDREAVEVGGVRLAFRDGA